MSTQAQQTTSGLPEGFDDFRPFIGWAIEGGNARIAKRLASTQDEVEALYQFGMGGRINDALAYCDQFPLDELPADAQRLMQILFSIAEVRPQIEEYNGVVPSSIVSPTRFLRTVEHEIW